LIVALMMCEQASSIALQLGRGVTAGTRTVPTHGIVIAKANGKNASKLDSPLVDCLCFTGTVHGSRRNYYTHMTIRS
jgi:hypothetical protein